MKNALFSPINWRKKKSFAEQQEEFPSTYARSFLSSPPRPRSARSPGAGALSPRRPPRPPSLDLSEPLPSVPSGQLDSESPSWTIASRGQTLKKPKRSMPELDGVWKGFLADMDEDPNLLHKRPMPKLPPFHHSNSDSTTYGVGRVSSRRRPVPCGNKSAHNLSDLKLERSPSPSLSTSSSDSLSDATDFDSLALFPAPPPLRVRRKIPEPLVLQPSISRSPLQQSPALSSLDSTPVTTPTTPTPLQSCRKTFTPPSILRKPSSPALSHNYPLMPDYLPPEPHYSHVFHTRPGRLAHSSSSPEPNIPPMTTLSAHRSTSSDTFTFANSSRQPRYEKPLPPVEVRQWNSNSASEVQWGIAV
ncbi:hypothetical protein D9757_000123 [Collybiopsis confluens]|uniref:Uncharacterized protein n=1 Tax=Collybiopsis confluens TaxID=2823264 RepID=A0A8H5I266_9AGAR|nr:hypothetical protein D9757_000123 [Collybiopsis confluens]